jgi:hypothetical protein
MHQFIADFAGWNTAGSTDDAWGTVGAFERGEHATRAKSQKNRPTATDAICDSPGNEAQKDPGENSHAQPFRTNSPRTKGFILRSSFWMALDSAALMGSKARWSRSAV